MYILFLLENNYAERKYYSQTFVITKAEPFLSSSQPTADR